MVIVLLEGLGELKKFSYLIGTQTRDLKHLQVRKFITA
jgi:hypothetical protein